MDTARKVKKVERALRNGNSGKRAGVLVLVWALPQKPVDPSLFIHRFADRLDFKKRMHAVANTALRLVASMKRDWMQTGGCCSLSPGLHCSFMATTRQSSRGGLRGR